MNQQELSLETIDSVIALYSNGKIEEAIDAIKLLNENYPNSPILFNILGACYKTLGRTQKAIENYELAIVIKPDYVDALYNLGNIYRELDQLNNSINNYKKVIHINPSHEEAQHNLGLSLYESGLLFEAIEHFEKALIINPKNSKVQINLGNIYGELEYTYEAIEQYEKVLVSESKNAVAYNNLATILKNTGQANEAIKNYLKALEINPYYPEARFNLGYIYQDLGQFDLAISQFESAISINKYPMAYHSLSHLKKYKATDPHIKQMKSLLSSKDLKQSERVHICLALANINEKLGNKIDFYKYLDEGNKLQKIELDYSLNQSIKEHFAIKKLFSLGTYSFPKSSSGKKPIFIVGMPRSGTSLVEQIISSHSQVYGAGELNTLTKLVTPIINNFIADDIKKLTERTILFIRDEYLDMLNNLNNKEKVITDKLPLNFQYIGFILSAFPEAKIIHLKRDARATCWSNYKYYFVSKNNGYSNNFQDLAGFYGLYEDLMNFWHEKYPNKIYDISYEDLTVNQEEETRKLLDYCDLQWDKNCLNFHTNERAVRTVSALQVRKKMYQGSSEAWKKHWAYIQPLTNALKPY